MSCRLSAPACGLGDFLSQNLQFVAYFERGQQGADSSVVVAEVSGHKIEISYLHFIKEYHLY